MISQGPFQPQWFYEKFFYVNKHKQIWSNIDFQHCLSRGSLSIPLWRVKWWGGWGMFSPTLSPFWGLREFSKDSREIKQTWFEERQLLLRTVNTALGLKSFFAPFKGEVLHQDLDVPSPRGLHELLQIEDLLIKGANKQGHSPAS